VRVVLLVRAIVEEITSLIPNFEQSTSHRSLTYLHSLHMCGCSKALCAHPQYLLLQQLLPNPTPQHTQHVRHHEHTLTCSSSTTGCSKALSAHPQNPLLQSKLTTSLHPPPTHTHSHPPTHPPMCELFTHAHAHTHMDCAAAAALKCASVVAGTYLCGCRCHSFGKNNQRGHFSLQLKNLPMQKQLLIRWVRLLLLFTGSPYTVHSLSP
jgi:hypothetical protein